MNRLEMKNFWEFSRGTSYDFHEPDEQEIEFVKIEGDHLDNAMGTIKSKLNNEIVITFKKNEKEYRFNLANLLSFAKYGVERYLGW